MAMLRSFLIILVLTILHSFCKQRFDQKLDTEKVTILKKKYGNAVINYFYETVFHEDEANKKRNNLHKWKSNPQIVLSGNPSAEQIRYVQDAIFKINQLHLPVKCVLNNKAKVNVLEIFFGDFDNMSKKLKSDSVIALNADPNRHLAIARSISHDGIILQAHIDIFYNSKDTLTQVRRNIVEEELIQALGVTGDSYSYPNSLFFQNYNPYKTFTTLDRDVLLLLYEDAIPFNLSVTSFESSFNSILYSINFDEKIKNLLYKFPKEFRIGSELELCFTEGKLLKHPKEVVVLLKGSVKLEDLVLINNIIKSINVISPNLQLRLATLGEPESGYGIILDLKLIKNQPEPIKRSIKILEGKDCMFNKLIKNEVILSYNNSERAQRLRPESFVDALYFSLIQLPQKSLQRKKLANIKNDLVFFDKHYASLLKIIYSNEFIDGLKLSDFKKIKSSHLK